MEKITYITYMKRLKIGFSSLVNALQKPNPIVEVYGAKEAKKRLYDARGDVEKLSVGIFTDDERKLFIRTFQEEINNMIHDVFHLDFSLCVQAVDKTLRPEWWLLANRLRERMEELTPLMEMYGEKVSEKTTKEKINEVPQQSDELPTVWGTDRERKVLKGAIFGGLMRIKDGRYVWLRTKSLLGYFCGKLYCDDFVRLDESDYSTELVKPKRKQLPRNELKNLFGFDVGANRDVLKSPPRDYELIDDLFMCEASK